MLKKGILVNPLQMEAILLRKQMEATVARVDDIHEKPRNGYFAARFQKFHFFSK